MSILSTISRIKNKLLEKSETENSDITSKDNNELEIDYINIKISSEFRTFGSR